MLEVDFLFSDGLGLLHYLLLNCHLENWSLDLFYEVSFFWVALCLYNSNIQPCMDSCCHVWAGIWSYYLELSDKLQKQICRTVDPSFAASLEPLALPLSNHHQNAVNFFEKHHFGRCPSELAQLVLFPYCGGRSTCYSDRLHISVTIARYF